MKPLTPFLRRCIAEVLIEPFLQPKKINGIHSLIKHCIAEVIVEPSLEKEGKYSSLALAALLTGAGGASFKPAHAAAERDAAKAAVVQKIEPQKELPDEKDMGGFELAAKYSDNMDDVAKKLKGARDHYFGPYSIKEIIKECTVEVLKEGILTKGVKEALDPSSQGPNIPQENPYQAWNAKMAKLEEEGEDHPHGRYAQQAGATPFEPPQDYEEIKTFQEIKDREDPKGENHDLRLECVHCGIIETCRCRKPKRTFKGYCQECAQNSLARLEWACPHCRKKASILIEAESPADYAAYTDCQHCGKEIGDPKLDKMIYETVMKHYKVLH